MAKLSQKITKKTTKLENSKEKLQKFCRSNKNFELIPETIIFVQGSFEGKYDCSLFKHL